MVVAGVGHTLHPVEKEDTDSVKELDQWQEGIQDGIQG